MGPKQNRKQGGGRGRGVETIFILQTSANDPFMLSTYLVMEKKSDMLI